jgi:hypothetical protein
MAKETTKKKEAVSKTESLVKREYTEEEKASITKYQELAKRKPQNNPKSSQRPRLGNGRRTLAEPAGAYQSGNKSVNPN